MFCSGNHNSEKTGMKWVAGVPDPEQEKSKKKVSTVELTLNTNTIKFVALD